MGGACSRKSRSPPAPGSSASSGPFLRYEQTSASTYALQIGPDLYIGASGGLDDFINHSCEPNAGLRIEGTTVDLHAIRDIAAGEEILFDYSTTLDEDDFTMSCQCGAPSCRETIGDGKYLPEDVWQQVHRPGDHPRVRAEEPRRAGVAASLQASKKSSPTNGAPTYTQAHGHSICASRPCLRAGSLRSSTRLRGPGGSTASRRGRRSSAASAATSRRAP